jgi:hypothetical protein
MKRRGFISKAAALGAALMAAPATSKLVAVEESSHSQSSKKLNPPARGRIPVAFLISEGVTVIDFAGPWEVFQDVMVGDDMAFELFTVSEKIETITGTAGLKLVPNYTFADVPDSKVVVIPAQKGSDRAREWLRQVSPKTDVTMSVCTGAFSSPKRDCSMASPPPRITTSSISWKKDSRR